jgi:hypothetical protein
VLRYAKLALIAIAAITAVSGALQLVAPGLVLRTVGGEVTPATSHFFAIIGMFMVLFGGLLWQSLRARPVLVVPLFWAALQKLGASAAVGIGVAHGLFAPVALLVAAFDLASGILALWYWNQVRGSAQAAAQ